MARRIKLPPLAVPVESDASVRRRAIVRARALGGVMLVALAGVGLRAAQLTLFPSDRTKLEVAVQRWDTVIQQAPRGQILDRSGHRLAVSRATAHVVVDPSRLAPNEVGPVAAKLADILGVEPVDILVRLEDGRARYRLLAKDVHPQRAQQADAVHEAVYLEQPPTRFYPEGTLAAHVLGFVNRDGTGQEGLEAEFDQYLEGGVLVRQRRRDRHGSTVDDSTQRGSFHAGMSVHLTLDRAIQQSAEDELAEIMTASRPEGASVVVVDVPTGDVLALANAPTFDPNDIRGPAIARRNRAVEFAQELGSVVKPLTVAAALHSQVIPATGLVDCSPPLELQGKRIRDTHPVSIASLRTLLAHSSNIGASRLGLAVGAERLVELDRQFGFGARTGIALPAESAGSLRAASELGPLSVANVAFGQGLAITPLQLTMAIAALGNEGRLMRPRLVSQVVDAHGVTEVVTRPEVVRQVVSPETARAVVDMMVGVTEGEGATGVRGRVPGFRVAGKTGTAQKPSPQGGYGRGRIASFVALVPAEAPRIAVLVVVDEPTRGSHVGGEVAAPVAARIAEYALAVLGVKPSRGIEQATPLADAVQAPPMAEAAPVSVEWAGDGWRVPDLTGQVARDAARLLAAADLSLTIEGHGRVVRQAPAAGAVVPAGSAVALQLR